MKNKLGIVQLSFLVIVAGILMSNRGGSPGGRTGSSTDQSTCGTLGGCHSAGNEVIVQEFISSDIPSEGYEPGKTYTISVSPSRENISVWGFEMMAEDASGNEIGDFMNSDDANLVSGQNRVTHKFASSSGAGGRTWDVLWKAPMEGSGEVQFFAACIAANGNGKTGGDNVMIDTLTVVEGAVNSLANLQEVELKLYPNPTSEKVFIKGNVAFGTQIYVFADNGNLVYESEYRDYISVTSWSSGLYHVKLVKGNKSVTKSFVKL